jgi:ADP-heptose:LPS heptosyltransferase
MLQQIIKKSDYYIVSAVDSEDFNCDRYMSLKNSSRSFDDYAAIISQVDCLISVDTVAYILADAFHIPAVVLFSTIPPEWRCKYFPYVHGIMLEKKNGLLYGIHNIDSRDKDALAYSQKIWERVDIEEVLRHLKKMVKKKAATRT